MAENFDDNLEQHSLRRASATMSLLATMQGHPGNKTGQNALLKESEEAPTRYLDEYHLAASYLAGVLEVKPQMQISKKDAPGKDREISTLDVGFGTACLIVEHLAMARSERTEEDMVLTRNKEAAIHKMVVAANNLKAKRDDWLIAFKNGDKSSYGPSAKSVNMFLEAAVLCPDERTYAMYELALSTNLRKEIRYPHNIIKEALRLHVKGNSYYKDNKLVLSEGYQEFKFDSATTTGTAMNLVQEQVVRGNDLGKKGSTYIKITDGFPGQGIFTINSSIKHAAVIKYISGLLKKVYGWEVIGKVTSDDDMCTLGFLSRDFPLFVRVYRRA